VNAVATCVFTTSHNPKTVRGQIEYIATAVSAEVVPLPTTFAQLSDECREWQTVTVN
jgi:hypothetical protein